LKYKNEKEVKIINETEKVTNNVEKNKNNTTESNSNSMKSIFEGTNMTNSNA